MGYTSSEVKMRYNDKAYKKVGISLRNDKDADIIAFIDANKEKIGTTQLFREALELYIRENGTTK